MFDSSQDRHTRREFLVGAAAASVSSAFPAVLSAKSTASPLCFTSAVEMAALIRAKKLSAREALAEHLKQIDRVNPQVNAIVTLVADQATAAAARADEMQAHGETLGPLHGLPVAHKDLIETAGVRTTFGSPLYKDNIPAKDNLLVTRMRAAGAIFLGKTNTPEFGAGSQTFNQVFGATHNPYDLTNVRRLLRRCSSRACLRDGAGCQWLRRSRFPPDPAAWCNIVGFRPSIGRVPNPSVRLGWSTRAHEGCLGRSTADLLSR